MNVRLLSKPFFSVASMLLVVALTLGMSRYSQAAVATYTLDGGATTLTGNFVDGENTNYFNNATFKFYGTADTSSINFDPGESVYFTTLNLTFEINDGGNKTVATFAQPWFLYSQQLSGGEEGIGFTNFSSGLQINNGSPTSSPGIFNNLASNGKWDGNFAFDKLLSEPFQTDRGYFIFDSSSNPQGAFFEISGAGGGAGGEVPEPTSMAIFGLGALGMAYRTRRKSKA